MAYDGEYTISESSIWYISDPNTLYVKDPPDARSLEITTKAGKFRSEPAKPGDFVRFTIGDDGTVTFVRSTDPKSPLPQDSNR